MSYFSVVRRLLGLSLQELSDLSGLSVSMIHGLEWGEKPMRPQYSEILGKAMLSAIVKKVSPEFLFRDLLQNRTVSKRANGSLSVHLN